MFWQKIPAVLKNEAKTRGLGHLLAWEEVRGWGGEDIATQATFPAPEHSSAGDDQVFPEICYMAIFPETLLLLGPEILTIPWCDLRNAQWSQAEHLITLIFMDSRSDLVIHLCEHSKQKIAYVVRERVQDTFLSSVSRPLVHPDDAEAVSDMRGFIRRGLGGSLVLDVLIDEVYYEDFTSFPEFISRAVEELQSDLSHDVDAALELRQRIIGSE